MNKPLILSLKSTHTQNTLITSFIFFLFIVNNFYYQIFIKELSIIITIILLISDTKYLNATRLILNKEYLLSPNGFPFLSYYKTVRINWADVQKTTLTAAPFTFRSKQNKEDSLEHIKLTFYTPQGKFVLYPEKWKINEIPPKMNKKERILQFFKKIWVYFSEYRIKQKKLAEERKKRGFFSLDISPFKPDSYTSTELDAYLYTLPLMQFLTEKNIKIQQDEDLLRTKYLGWVLVGVIMSPFILFIFNFR